MDSYHNCIEQRAFKSSFHRELAMKAPVQHVLFEDILVFNAINNCSADDFSVDTFLDFSNGCEFKDGFLQEQLITDEEEEKDYVSVFSQDDINSNSCSSFSDSPPATELSVPEEYKAELEWVSQFVDDSPSEFSLLCADKKTQSHANNRFEPIPESALTKAVCIFSFKIPAKARTKRSRPTSQTWSVNGSQSPSSSTSSSSSTSCLSSEPPTKIPKKRFPVRPCREMGGSAQFQRRCTHCGVQKTPQWRTGPLGAKTLCNACGVRYKSGRLLPEYRPACSPSFSSDIHSNSHRKVLEMRRRKEMGEPELEFNRMVTSF